MMRRLRLMPIFGVFLLLQSCPLIDLISGGTPDVEPFPMDSAFITGLVWNDECKVPFELPAQPPPGCVENSFNTPNFGSLVANGTLDPGEFGMVGIAVDLGQGACPAVGYSRTYTDYSGAFGFYNLPAGTYCVSVNPLDPENEIWMIPGGFSVPGFDIGYETITIEPGTAANVSFGWDFQEVG